MCTDLNVCSRSKLVSDVVLCFTKSNKDIVAVLKTECKFRSCSVGR